MHGKVRTGLYRFTLILLMAAGAVIRFHSLMAKPYWFDECFSVEVARISWGNFVHLLWWREANMSLYYLLLRFWLHFGQSAFFVRSLSVVISAATIPTIYWLGRLLYERRVGLIAAAAFTFNAYSVRYAQEARSYGLFLLLATLSSCFLIVYVRGGSRRSRTAYILASVLAVYAHFYALLLVAAQWLTIRWRGLPKAESDQNGDIGTGLKRAWIAIGIAVAPLLSFVAKTGAGPIKWIQRPGVGDVLKFFENLSGSNSWPLLIVYVVACGIVLWPARRSMSGEERSWEAWRGRFLLIWLLFPVALTVVLSFARPVFLGRYMIFCLPALVILAAAGLARLRPAWLMAVIVCAVLLLSAQGVPFVYGHDFDNERDASGAAVNFILDHSQLGDAIIFHIAATRVPYEFFRSERSGQDTASANFRGELGPEILFPHHGAGLDYRDFTGKPSAEFVRSAIGGHPRVWVMLMNNGPVGNPDATTVMLTQVLGESFPKKQRWEFFKVEIQLYSK